MLLCPRRSNPPAANYGKDFIDWEEQEDACKDGVPMKMVADLSSLCCDSVPTQTECRETYRAQSGAPPEGKLPITRTLVVLVFQGSLQKGQDWGWGSLAGQRMQSVITISQRYNSQVPIPIMQIRKF